MAVGAMALASRLSCRRGSAVGRSATATGGTATTGLGGFVALTKPRIIELLLVTTIPTMILAADGWPGTWLVIATLIGGTLAAGGANAINMVVDRDIDRLMPRTQHRPLVTGVVAPARGARVRSRARARGLRVAGARS